MPINWVLNPIRILRCRNMFWRRGIISNPAKVLNLVKTVNLFIFLVPMTMQIRFSCNLKREWEGKTLNSLTGIMIHYLQNRTINPHAQITTKQLPASPDTFEVIITDNNSKTTHQVTVPDALYQKLTNGTISKEECAKAAFKFLLDRESKESIMSTFELSVISEYFPEFERVFGAYL